MTGQAVTNHGVLLVLRRGVVDREDIEQDRFLFGVFFTELLETC